MDEHRLHGVNVKVHRLPDVKGEQELGQDKLNSLFEDLQQEFWATLNYECKMRFEVEISQEGRMGGWAVPHPVIDRDSPKWLSFERFVNQEWMLYVHTLWPDRVRAALGELEHRRDSNTIRSVN